MRYWLIGFLLLASVPAQAKQHRVSLTWTASAGCPNGCTITGYYVYRAWKRPGPFTRITPAPLTTLFYTDKNVQAGQTVYYVVTAIDSAGVESQFSDEKKAVVPWR